MVIALPPAERALDRRGSLHEFAAPDELRRLHQHSRQFQFHVSNDSVLLEGAVADLHRRRQI
jgi:hypothetical protein